MALAHYGRLVPLEELRAACGVSRDGAKASNVVKAARLYGLEAKAKRLELPGLADLKLPAIAFWNFNHFVVVEGLGPKGVQLNDPAAGTRRVSWEEFDVSFTGVMLVLEPGPEFTKGGKQPSVVRGLATRLRGGAVGLVLCLLAGLALILPGLASAAFLKIFVDQVLVAGNSSWLLPVAAGPGLSICCFRHRPADVDEQALDAHNERLVDALQRDGRVYVSNATIDGHFALRACITNFRTTRADVERVLTVVRELAG